MGKYVWKLTVNVIIVKDDGNVMDGVLNGVVMALMDMRKPFVKVMAGGSSPSMKSGAQN
jgi:exosome complex RNA-binding protein Rrp42 (RNase PH superfamily)